MHVYPSWYVDLLVDGLRAEAQEALGGEPEQAAPDTLEEWR